MACDWAGEIQNTLVEERNQVIRKALDEFVRGADLAVDLGCGVGNYLIALATRAMNVVGLDISKHCIEHAQRECEKYGKKNCKLFVIDLGSPECLGQYLNLGISSASVVLCVNALISPDPDTRREMLSKGIHMLRPSSTTNNDDGGVLLLVVPSVESAQLELQRHRSWVKQRRRRRLRRLRSEREEPTCEEDEAAGVYCRNGVRTKHYSEEEVSSLLRSAGFMILRQERVIYDWSLDLAKVGAPRPFDWLVVARRSLPEVCSDDA